MRPVREITSEEENARFEPFFENDKIEAKILKRDPVKPEPEGTIVLMAFVVDGYDEDCDGALGARLKNISADMEETGWYPNKVELYPTDTVVVTEAEWRGFFNNPARSFR